MQLGDVVVGILQSSTVKYSSQALGMSRTFIEMYSALSGYNVGLRPKTMSGRSQIVGVWSRRTGRLIK